jgi:hypothetical protein
MTFGFLEQKLTSLSSILCEIGGASGILGKAGQDPMMALAAKRRISVATWNIAAINNNVSAPMFYVQMSEFFLYKSVISLWSNLHLFATQLQPTL